MYTSGLTVIWSSRILAGSGFTHGPLGSSKGLATAHTDCLIGSGQLHSMAGAVLGNHPMVMTIPKCLDLFMQLASLSPKASSGFSSLNHASTPLHDPFNPGNSTSTEGVTSPTSWSGPSLGQASAALQDPFPLHESSKPVLSGELLKMTIFGCQHEVESWLLPERSFRVLILRIHFPDFTSLMLIFV